MTIWAPNRSIYRNPKKNEVQNTPLFTLSPKSFVTGSVAYGSSVLKDDTFNIRLWNNFSILVELTKKSMNRMIKYRVVKHKISDIFRSQTCYKRNNLIL